LTGTCRAVRTGPAAAADRAQKVGLASALLCRASELFADLAPCLHHGGAGMYAKMIEELAGEAPSTSNFCNTYVHYAGLYNCLHRLLEICISDQSLVVHIRHGGSRREGKIDKQDCDIDRGNRKKKDQNSSAGFS
jgi:hypothetical protein